MDSLKNNIDKQIEFNQGKNIFLDTLDIFQFANETIRAISDFNGLNDDSRKFLIEYSTDKALEEFCRVNQYYTFDSKTKDQLKNIYAELFENIETKTDSIENISKKHYDKLKQWLKESNPFAETIYKNAGNEINPVTCSEYSPALQISILKIDVEQLMQPVLDIGCGKMGHLVTYLKNHGIDVMGIDRFDFTTSGLINANWLEYDYGSEKWGTIISHLGFSNHFNHHHLRVDGDYFDYAKTYMRILHALKPEGSFHYVPDLPFIEKFLDANQFSIQKNELNEGNFKSTIIKRL